VSTGDRNTALDVVLCIAVLTPIVPFGAQVEVVAVLIHAEYVSEYVVAA
jgi:hypothetical protein